MTLLYWNFCVVKVCHLGKQSVRKVFHYVLKYYHKYFKISLSIAWTACLCHVILLCDFAMWFCHVICHAMLSRDFCHVIYQWLVGQAGFSIDLHYVSPWCAIWRLIYLCTVKESSDMSPKKLKYLSTILKGKGTWQPEEHKGWKVSLFVIRQSICLVSKTTDSMLLK